MHILGTLLLASCPIILGFGYARNLQRAREELLDVVSFLERFKTQIRFERRGLLESLSAIAQDPQFSSLPFIGQSVVYMKEQPFPEAWEKAIREWKSPINEEDQKRIGSLSGILGASDVQGQIDTLDLVEEEFLRSCKQQQEMVQTKGKMVRSLGILMACGLFILMI